MNFCDTIICLLYHAIVTHFYKYFTLFTPFQALSVVLILIKLNELIDLDLPKGHGSYGA